MERSFGTAYFHAEIVGQKLFTRILTPSLQSALEERMLSLEVSEEAGKFMTGNLSFYDCDSHDISFIMKRGTVLDLEWGYKYPNEPSFSTGEIMGILPPRRRARVMVLDPAGEAGENGAIKYTCSFMQYVSGRDKMHMTFPETTPMLGIISTMMTRMGIPVNNQIVHFPEMLEMIQPGEQIVCDHKTAFSFLTDLAKKYRCIFKVDYMAQSAKVPVAIFATQDSLAQLDLYLFTVTGAAGKYNYYRFKTGDNANVRSYSWSMSQMDQGGDSVQLVMINGQPMFMRQMAETGVVQYYKFHPDKMSSEMSKQGNFVAKTDLYKEWMNIGTFQELLDRKYFTVEQTTTAPQGIGFTINLVCVGQPFVLVPCKCLFEGSFPDYFQQAHKKGLTFWTRRVTHRIDRNGYFMNCDVVDSFTLNGGSLIG